MPKKLQLNCDFYFDDDDQHMIHFKLGETDNVGLFEISTNITCEDFGIFVFGNCCSTFLEAAPASGRRIITAIRASQRINTGKVCEEFTYCVFSKTKVAQVQDGFERPELKYIKFRKGKKTNAKRKTN